eukprot:RCo008101
MSFPGPKQELSGGKPNPSESLSSSPTPEKPSEVVQDPLEPSEDHSDDGMEALSEANAEVRKAVCQYEAEVSAWKVARVASKPTVISPKLIAQRCLDKALLEQSESTAFRSPPRGEGSHTLEDEEDDEEDDALSDAILRVTHLSLENCNIAELENLDWYSEVTHAFFQHNQISRIGDSLIWLTKLRVLLLSHNCLTAVEGVKDLPQLSVLDLSHNQLQSCPPEELPVTLTMLQLEGNPLTERRESMLKPLLLRLPGLIQLDGVPVTAMTRARLGLVVSEAVLQQHYSDLTPQAELIAAPGKEIVEPEPAGENLRDPSAADGEEEPGPEGPGVGECHVGLAFGQALST